MFREKKKKYNYNSLFLIFMCLLFCFSFFPKNITIASADFVIYSNVLDDLKKDENFDINDYPANYTDYSLNVIQVAEGSSGELFVYVYQPCAYNENLLATSINISTGINDNLYYINYKLSFLNSDGVFYKYKVDHFVLKTDALRYYNISSIYRNWNEKYDASIGNDNTISEVACNVSKLFTLCTINNNVYFNCSSIETIIITDKTVGFIRYTNGFVLYKLGACDSHYVAFNTDKRIDKLLEADVTYISQSCRSDSRIGGGSMLLSLDSEVCATSSDGYTYGDEIENYVSLNYDDQVDVTTGFIFHREYSWSRIKNVSDFKAELENDNIKLDEDVEASLSNKQWVLRFAETPYSFSSHYHMLGGMSFLEKKTIVKEMTILRLKFETDGVVYNLGVVDNKQTGNTVVPSGETPSYVDDFLSFVDDFATWAKYFLVILFVIFLFVVFWPFIPSLLSFFVKIGKLILDVLWFIVKTIFKPIVWLFKKKE